MHLLTSLSLSLLFALTPPKDRGGPEVAAVPWPADAAEATAVEDPLQVTTFVLDNGLTVMLSENHARPEVFGAVAVRTGGKNDPPDNTGMAHYLEHMLFKGTQDLGTTDWRAEQPIQQRIEELYERLRSADAGARAGIQAELAAAVSQSYRYAVPGELDALLGQIGGTGVNAFTTYDETVYHNTFPASQLQAWLAIYAHRFENPVFRLFPTELEAVYEEKNIAIDTTGYELFRRFMRAAFPQHPYGTNDVLGEVDHLKRPSLRAMKAYFERWYVPGNMVLVLSGDFDTATVRPWIEAEFGRWAGKPTPAPPARTIAPFRPGERVAMRLSPIRVGAVAFRTPREADPEFAELSVARLLLSNEQRSGLVDRLSDDGKVLLAMHVPADLADSNLDVVAYAPRLLTQSFAGAERLVLRQFERIAKGEFDDAEFEALRTALLTKAALRWEDNRERALAMAHAFVARGGWQGQLDYLARLRDMTKADVVRAAARMFGASHLTIRSRAGYPKKQRLEKPKTPPVTPVPGAHSSFYRGMQGRPSPPPKLSLVDPARDLTHAVVRDGVTLHGNGNPFNDIYTLELRFGVGTDDIRELDMLADVLGRIGGEHISRERFHRELFRLSTTLEARAESDRFVVTLQGPEQHRTRALRLLTELLDAPAFERRPLRQVRREIWGYRRIGRKDAGNVADALRERVVWGEQSKYRRETGPGGARALGPERLRRAWRTVQDYAIEARYVGRKPLVEIARALDHALPPGVAQLPAKPQVIPARVLPSQTTVYFVPRRDAVQTRLWFAVDGAAVVPADRAAADAFSEYFGGGMAGLVFQEVRELRALAYSAHGDYERDDEPQQHGWLQGFVGCQADKTFEAIDVMLGLITQMPSKPERMGMVKQALSRSQETATPPFRELQAELETWRRRGHDGDPRPELMAGYAQIEFDDIERFYREHVAARPVAIMVVGDPRKVKPKDLARYGKVVRVREGSLYSR